MVFAMGNETRAQFFAWGFLRWFVWLGGLGLMFNTVTAAILALVGQQG